MFEFRFAKEKKMIYLIWLLRIIHIVAGVFWVGGSLIMAFFVAPTAAATGESGRKFVGHLMNSLKFTNRMSMAAGATVLAGFLLYALDARAGEAWLQSNFAMGLGIGAAFAIVGFVFGILLSRSIRSLVQLGAQIQGRPTNEQMTHMQKIQNRQRTYSMINVVALILATVFMAIARYL
jgi:uncharacterized membrane protein